MRLRIGYFGDGPWAHDAFHRLAADRNVEISFVCVRYETADPMLQELAAKSGVPCYRHASVNAADFVETVSRHGCDLLVSMSFNQIFRGALIGMARHGLINCHAGKLPFYRGRNILNWALINDEREFGITVHYVDDGIDTGDIILQRTYPITDADTYATLLAVAHRECGAVLHDAISLIRANAVRRIVQHDVHPFGSYFPQRQPGDEVLNWDQPSRVVFNFVRAIGRPGPMARTGCDGHEVMINRVSLIPSAPSYVCVPGAIVGKDLQGLIVKTRDTVVRLDEWETKGRLRVGARLCPLRPSAL